MSDVKSRIAKKCDFSSVFLRGGCCEADGTAFRRVPSLWKLEFTDALRRLGQAQLIARGRLGGNFCVTNGVETEFVAQGSVELLSNFRIRNEKCARVLAALPNAFTRVTDPRAALFHQLLCDAQVQQIAFAGHALTVEDVNFGLAERRGNFVLHHFYLGSVADHSLSVLDRRHTADLDAHRRVKL